MADEEALPSAEADNGENLMLQEAIEALRLGDRVRARDLLTRLLKTAQNNATYWVWLSAAVETHKERVYCLQTALQVDPQNAAAKRGLTLLGVLPPDEAVAPFPLNHPRLWEENLKIREDPKEKPVKRGLANPFVRMGLILGGGIIVLLVFYFAIFAPRRASHTIWGTPMRGPTATITPTPTNTPIFRTVTPTFGAPTPLYLLLDATYTPTPLYITTQHPAVSSDAFNAAIRYFRQGNCGDAVPLFEQVIGLEPEAADAYYYIGECYRLDREYQDALDAYQQAINLDAEFAPGFLGRAIVFHALNPDADVASYYDEAISLDPQFTLAYIERAVYRIERGELQGAMRDLEIAGDQDPNSAVVQMYIAEVELARGQYETALESALRANRLDITLLRNYLVLGKAYAANDQLADAIGALQMYTLYQSDDAEAYSILGSAYNAVGDHRSAVSALNRSISLYSHNGEAYYQRGLAYLNLENPDQAIRDFNLAQLYDPDNYDAYFGMGMAYYAQELFGNAYIQMEKALGAAQTDEEEAQALYWEAVCLENINDLGSARAAWRRLLQLPEDAMLAEWRQQAYEALGVTPTSTPTPRPTRTPTP